MDKVNFENALQTQIGLVIKEKRAINSENAFKSTAFNAGLKAMKVNTLKTNILCVQRSAVLACGLH